MKNLKYKLKLKFYQLTKNDKKIRKYENIIKNRIINSKKYKYIHLMNNGLHTVNIIHFINKYFDNAEHAFVFPCVLFDETAQKLQNFSNVYSCKLNQIKFNSVDKIIIHGLFDPNLVSQLYKMKTILKKTYWFIWGGDLYSAKRNKKDDFVRQHVAGILTSFDRDVYEKRYEVNKPCYDVTYPHDIVESMITEDLKTKGVTHIQINNSADGTTLEMLDILSKFKDESIKVTTILSYITVGQKDLRLQIMKKGYEIFGHKFNPIIDFMPKEKYVNHLASVDIYISNQNRQQGNGNTTFIHSLGGKIFLKNDTSVYQKYNSIGMKIFDTYDIKDMTFDEFCAFDETQKEQSVSILRHRMKDETKVAQWKDFFNVR